MSEPPGTEVELSGPRRSEIARAIAARSEQLSAPGRGRTSPQRLALASPCLGSRHGTFPPLGPTAGRSVVSAPNLRPDVRRPSAQFGLRGRAPAGADRPCRPPFPRLAGQLGRPTHAPHRLAASRASHLGWARDGVRPSWLPLDLVLSAYGTLAAVATSQPVALAGLFTLTLDAFKLLGATAFWTVKQISGHIGEPPLPLQGQHEGEVWEERTTKSLQPLLMAAVEAGHGLEYECGQIRIVVPPGI